VKGEDYAHATPLAGNASVLARPQLARPASCATQ
jgi:hypothetical protein